MRIKCNRIRIAPKPAFKVDENSILANLRKGESKEIECPYCGNIGVVVTKANWFRGRNTAAPTKGHAKGKERGITRIKLIKDCTLEQKGAIVKNASQEFSHSCYWDGDQLVIVGHLSSFQIEQLQKFPGLECLLLE